VSRQIAGKEPKRTLAKKKEKISSCSASKEIARKKNPEHLCIRYVVG